MPLLWQPSPQRHVTFRVVLQKEALHFKATSDRASSATAVSLTSSSGSLSFNHGCPLSTSLLSSLSTSLVSSISNEGQEDQHGIFYLCTRRSTWYLSLYKLRVEATKVTVLSPSLWSAQSLADMFWGMMVNSQTENLRQTRNYRLRPSMPVCKQTADWSRPSWTDTQQAHFKQNFNTDKSIFINWSLLYGASLCPQADLLHSFHVWFWMSDCMLSWSVALHPQKP